MIDQSYGGPKITKDGVTVAKAIELNDKYHNVGAHLVKQVASATNDVAGDGTTTATALARAILREGIMSVAAGMNPMDLRRGISAAVEQVVEVLKSRATMISTPEEIAQVATISANGDKEIGDLIARAMEKVGKEGVITVSDGKTLENEMEVVEGMKFDRGFISPYFANDQKTMKCEYEDVLILIVEKKISGLNPILPILEKVVQKQSPLLIIAEDVESEALATLILNKLRGGLKLVAVKAPGFGENRKNNLQDIATLTGAQVVSDELGHKLEKLDLDMLGSAKKVTITKDDTIMLDGGGSKVDLQGRCDRIREEINSATSDYDREKLQERLAKLSGGVAVLKIGGASEVEVSEKKDRVTDSLNATKAAVEDGIVAGGGVALLHAAKTLKKLREEVPTFHQKIGISIVEKALKVPAKRIADNAGEEGAVVVGKIEAEQDHNFGFDAAEGVYGDLVNKGIIDPLKVTPVFHTLYLVLFTQVVRTALMDAASVSSLITTSECVITDIPEDKKAAPAPPPDYASMY